MEDVKRETFVDGVLSAQIMNGVDEVKNTWVIMFDGRQVLRCDTSHPQGSQCLVGIELKSTGQPLSYKNTYTIGLCDGGESGMRKGIQVAVPEDHEVVVEAEQGP